ncbi:MAG: membrane-bound lytic murein transglycosylase MltF [Gammaproteobacteria bacterium]|nr:membrane-bound lytic murein transglycosylase MltF [Gammaproteobacteria bacterium]
MVMMLLCNKLAKAIAINALLFALVACDSASINDLAEGQELVVLTRNAPTTWYEGREGITGPEYDLVNSFASYYKLNVRFEIIDSIDEILNAINNDEAHISAAGITITDKREMEGLIFSEPYQKVQQLVVCRRGNSLPKTVDELVDLNLEVINGSSYIETLNQLKLKIPGLHWHVSTEESTEQLLEKVWQKNIDCTLADSNVVSINRRYYPELMVAFPVSEEQSLAWVISPKWPGLKNNIEAWLASIEKNGDLAVIMEKYYGHFEIYDYVDIKRFRKRINQRLPKYKNYFKSAANKYNLPWTLLAAQAYQESHWNPKAKSPTGVRGMMMLTLNTAKAVDVKNRLDVVQSINGGAKYLQRMIKRIPDEVEENDRLWFALASYNVGFGHLQDARKLAEQLGVNPNRWVDMKEVLPLLAVKKHYKTLKHGYARGSEPVQYVQRIREYQQILEQQL